MFDETEIEVFRLCVRINRLRYQIVRDYRMTPKFAGLAQALGAMRHELETQAQDLMTEITITTAEGKDAFGQARQEVAKAKAAVADVKAFVADLQGSNGAPTLGDSSITSDQSQPEQLTVNGVSKV